MAFPLLANVGFTRLVPAQVLLQRVQLDPKPQRGDALLLGNLGAAHLQQAAFLQLLAGLVLLFPAQPGFLFPFGLGFVKPAVPIRRQAVGPVDRVREHQGGIDRAAQVHERAMKRHGLQLLEQIHRAIPLQVQGTEPTE